MKTLRLWDRITHYFSPHFIAPTWDLISAFEWCIDGGLKGKMNCPTHKSFKSEILRTWLQVHLFPKCSLEFTGRWACVFQCISVFSPVLNLCPHYVYSASLLCGQGVSFWIQEAAELPSVAWARINWQKCLIWLFLPLQGRCFPHYWERMTLCLSESSDVWNNHCVVSDPGSAGLGRLRWAAGPIPSEIRFAQCLLELAATPPSGLFCDFGFSVRSSSSLSRPGCLHNWRGWVWHRKEWIMNPHYPFLSVNGRELK